MSKKEYLAKLYIIIKQLFQNYKLPENELEDEFMWQLFKGFDFNLVQVSLIDFAKENSFFEPARVVAKCEYILNSNKKLEQVITEVDILNEINNTYSGYGNYIEKFNNLSEIAKRIVGSPKQLENWGRLDMQDFDTVIASAILRNAKALINNKEKIDKVNKLLMENKNILMLDN